MTDTMTVHEALSAVMRDVGAIGKNRKADPKMGGYAFRGIDDVYNALHGPLVEHGVFFVPDVLAESESSYQTSGGSTMRLVRVRVRYRFYGPAGDHIEAVTVGEAADTGDKAANKAMTAALKYLLFQVLCIPTLDNEDPDASGADLSGGRQANGRTQAPKKVDLSDIQQQAFDAVKGLDEQARGQVKTWMVDNGLPEQFGQLSDEQADAVLKQCDDLAAVPF